MTCNVNINLTEASLNLKNAIEQEFVADILHSDERYLLLRLTKQEGINIRKIAIGQRWQYVMNIEEAKIFLELAKKHIKYGRHYEANTTKFRLVEKLENFIKDKK